MNETALIFISIAAFGVGYGLAHFTKNLRVLASDWGIFSIILIPLVAVFLVIGVAFFSDLRSVLISSLLAAGFVFRMVRR